MLRSFSWRELIHYGEIFGFLTAWAVGLVIALGGQPAPDEPGNPNSMQVVSSTPLPSAFTE